MNAEVRLYDSLFTVPDPDSHDYLEVLNKDSLKILTDCKLEPMLGQAKPGIPISLCVRAISALIWRVRRNIWCLTVLSL